MPDQDLNLGRPRLGSVVGIGPETSLAQKSDRVPKSHEVSMLGGEEEDQGRRRRSARAHPAKTLGSSRGHDYAQQPAMQGRRQPRA